MIKHTPPARHCARTAVALEKVLARNSGQRGLLSRAEVAGWKRVFQSFDAFSPVYTKLHGIALMDWNPISQRVVVDRNPDVRPQLHRTFHEIADVVDGFVVDVHESLHVLLLEPFLTGRQSFASSRQLQEAYLSFEAFGFWYCDVILSPRLRVAMPDTELHYSRETVSSPRFSPARALKAVGVTREDAALRLYVAAFNGRPTRLATRDEVFARSLARRIYGFYFNWKKTLGRLHHYFKEMSVIGELQRRFCRRPGIPSIFSDRTLDEFSPSDVERYLVQVWKTEIPSFGSIPRARLDAVRCRRRIQTRAYFAYVVLAVLEQRMYFSGSRKPLGEAVRTKVVGDLGAYLDQLDAAMSLLIAGNTRLALVAVTRADDLYSRRVLRVVRAHDLWVAERRYYHDLMQLELGTRTFGIGARAVGRRDVELITKLMIEAMRHRPDLSPALMSAFAELSRLVDITDPARRLRQFKAFLKKESVVRLWSVPLADIDPRAERFREPINYFA